MNLFFGDMLPPNAEVRRHAAAEGVLVGTASPVRLRIEKIRHHLTPSGTTCVATYLGKRLIGRCAVPEESAGEFLEMELFDKPVSLALSVRPGGPGLEGNLLALVPLSDVSSDGPPGGSEGEDWRRSVPGAGYDSAALASEGGEQPLAGVFLGQVVRLDDDRKHPDNLLREAADMLSGVVRGRIGNIVDRLLSDVRGSGS
jgi:hypothetical protein